jgi:hypothetical protein
MIAPCSLCNFPWQGNEVAAASCIMIAGGILEGFEGGFVNLVEVQYLDVMISELLCGRLRFRQYLDVMISDI